MDAPEHTRYRRLLAGRFTVRRMHRLTERIGEITAEHLDAMERRGPGTDLVEAFARPIPALTICELLGVPYADRERFQRHAHTLMAMDVTPEEKYAAMAGLQEYMAELIAAKWAGPCDDLLSNYVLDLRGDDRLRLARQPRRPRGRPRLRHPAATAAASPNSEGCAANGPRRP